MTNDEYRRLWTRLTRRRNAYEAARTAHTRTWGNGPSRDALRTAATALLNEARYGLDTFERTGCWPDAWSDWERAAEDALLALRYTED